MEKRAIGHVGTITRFILAPILIYFGFRSPIEYIVEDSSVSLLPGYIDDLVVGIIVFPLIMISIQLVWKYLKNKSLRATGSIGFSVNFIITLMLFYSPLQHAMWFFLGFSLLIAAIRGYAGCEIMAISNWVTGRNDQVGCVLFSPIDSLEKRDKL
jgi:hypothetical protein